MLSGRYASVKFGGTWHVANRTATRKTAETPGPIAFRRHPVPKRYWNSYHQLRGHRSCRSRVHHSPRHEPAKGVSYRHRGASERQILGKPCASRYLRVRCERSCRLKLASTCHKKHEVVRDRTIDSSHEVCVIAAYPHER